MTIPVVGNVIVLGYLGSAVISAIEGAIVVGGLSALGAALYSIGIPKDSVIQYEAALKSDSFLVTVNGPAEEVLRARAVVKTFNPTRLDLHEGTKAAESAIISSMRVSEWRSQDGIPQPRPCRREIARTVGARPESALLQWIENAMVARHRHFPDRAVGGKSVGGRS